MEENNIFKFATKELSQDAFICWLIEWINHPEEKELYKCAKNFIDYIINKRNEKYKNKKILLNNYKDIEVKKQEANIDVLVTIDNTYCIIIEDKKLTTEHDDQIKRYKEILKVKGDYKEENIITVYYKPYEEPDEDIIRKKVDVYIDRKTINTEILKKEYIIHNNIYIDYKKFLDKLEEKIKNIKNIPISKWTDNRELFYKFAYDYNKHLKNNEYELRKCTIENVRGGIYIDVHRILLEDMEVKNKFKKMFEMLYISINLNYERCELRIRAKVREYEQKTRDEINELLMKLYAGAKVTRQQKGKNINLITMDLDKDTSYDELNKNIKDSIRILEKILKEEK